MTSDSPLTRGMKAYKTVYGLVKPFLILTAVTGAFLSLFRAREGSGSRVIALLVFVCSALLLAAGYIADRRLAAVSGAYRIYRSRIAHKADLQNLVPLIAVTIMTALPFYLILVTSFKDSVEANAVKFTWWPKDGVDLGSYRELFSYGEVTGISMPQAILNSFIYAIVPTAVGLFASALSAYAFSKLRFKGSRVMYNLLIMTMLMPGCVTMATSYLMFSWYGWVNSPLPLIVPGLFGQAATVMFLREFFMGIPDGLLEAAYIDGAGRWKSFFLILLPLAKPALVAQFVLGFITKFNDYMGPLIYLNDPSKYTVQVAIDFLNGRVPDNALIASASVVALVPMLTLYVFFRKQILSGISMSSGIKG